MRRTQTLALVLLCLLPLAACDGPGEEIGGDSPLADVRDTLGEDTTLSEGATRGPPEIPEVGEEGDAASGDTVATDDDPDMLPGWTSGRVSWEPPSRPRSPVVDELRQARNDGYDRLVVELRGDDLPGYAVEYVDKPLTECGSGHQVHPVGDAWLELRLDPAQGHTDAGEATMPRERETPALRRGLRIYRTCDFEGTVTLVLAVDSPEPFRAFHLTGPARVVVDVRH